MIRLLLTTGTMLFISSVYFLYVSFVVPFTVAQKIPADQVVAQVSGYQPPVLSDTVSEHFSEVKWLQAGEIKTFQSKNTLFYTRDVERDKTSGNKVRMSPIAMLWTDPRRPDEKPYRLIAETGIVQFENQFFDAALHLKDAKPGRIVWATLEGVVHIDGADGLVIDGKQFVFSEQSGQLYSDYPVSFHYGPTANDQTEVAGTADQINLSLTPSDDAVLGKDMPRVGGVSVLTLRKDVRLDTTFFEDGVRHQALLTCDGPFEYHVLKKQATFNSRVKITHLEPGQERVMAETLEAERLRLQFEPAPNAKQNGKSSEFFDDLVLREVRAFGSTKNGLVGRNSQIRIRSEQQKLVATMQDLAYDVVTRTARFLDPKQVVVKRGDATFACPNVLVEHTVENRIQKIECRGPGSIEVSHERFGKSHAEASWVGAVNVMPDETGPLHILELLEGAQVVIPEMESVSGKRTFEMGMAANQLRLWVDLEKAERIKEPETILNQELPLTRALAAGNVKMVSKDVIIENSDLINVLLVPGVIQEEADNKILGASYTDDSRSSKERDPIYVSTDQIQINLIHDQSNGKIELKKLDGVGNVNVRHQPEASPSLQQFGGESPVVLTGTRVVATRDGAEDQQVTVLGTLDQYGEIENPATVEFGPTRIGGANLSFNQKRNEVSVIGPGAFLIPVTRDLDGKELDQPATLKVEWQEKMVFNGLDARFFEAVSCSLSGHQESISRMNCNDLTVRLSQRISLLEKPDPRKKVDVKSIEARLGVQLESRKFEGTKLVGVYQGELAEFTINQLTGDFVGLGDGEIHSWSLGDGLKLAPSDAAEANRPIRSDKEQKWRYSRLKFSGKLTGNFEQKVANFERQRIGILSAPVEQAQVKFKEDHVSMVKDAVRLDCRTLKIFQKEFNDRAYWELFAQNVNELEGQVFRAVADELSFDERLGRFILRGIGKDATLYFQERPGASFSPSSHRLIEFIPKKRSITVDGSSGLGG
ncbi:hypothetical protein [Thalassoglobus polymorphus]|uniref:OstA-like protein n=1 Tax=Thalassoglobus polymorphus TaxID=2527994 RepID=A0A517QQ69_9PLAN|nr:hypothetical protein [Thalassoglobus polymorphus]QDT33754.1 hypothetical protein Mal48_30090 [Thalassoglobus polymorphus]